MYQFRSVFAFFRSRTPTELCGKVNIVLAREKYVLKTTRTLPLTEGGADQEPGCCHFEGRRLKVMVNNAKPPAHYSRLVYHISSPQCLSLCLWSPSPQSDKIHEADWVQEFADGDAAHFQVICMWCVAYFFLSKNVGARVIYGCFDAFRQLDEDVSISFRFWCPTMVVNLKMRVKSIY
jgi:hypothetical protein